MYFVKMGDELINLALVRYLRREGNTIFFKFSNKEYYKHVCKTDSSAQQCMTQMLSMIQDVQEGGQYEQG